MLDAALLWARRTFDTAIVAESDGTVHDRPSYPLVAFRELVANALIHRDLDHWSAGLAVEVRLLRDRLVVANPGGLYGITVDRLGRDAVTSARNARLVAICQHVRTPQTGARVIEALASGIPTVTEALADHGLPPAHYVDSGIRFTVILHQFATATPAVTAEPELGATERRIYQALTGQGKTVLELTEELGLSAPNMRKSLRNLRSRGLVVQLGGRGRTTTHQRRPDGAQSRPPAKDSLHPNCRFPDCGCRDSDATLNASARTAACWPASTCSTSPDSAHDQWATDGRAR